MHGLINRSIQCFVRDTYGAPLWQQVAASADLGFENFEALMLYDDALTYQVIRAAEVVLKKPKDSFLEDLGTYLCSHENLEAVRRLLRFGGETFPDFLCSLDDLHDRARLAVPELEMPRLDLRTNTPGLVTMRCISEYPGFGHVMVGVLRAMSDDYGTLTLLEHMGSDGGEEIITIQMLKAGHSKGRAFALAAGVG